ncbi:MAG: hypothetical protein MK180_07700 [Rhodobacteraceae bacterium]|nr:hypothetical protein [Paracoccaceae bacterium]
MDLLIGVGLPLSLAFIMFSLGVGLTGADFARVIRAPKAFIIGAVAQILLLPLVAFGLLHVFSLAPALSVGVMIQSFMPGGVTTSILTWLAGDTVAGLISGVTLGTYALPSGVYAITAYLVTIPAIFLFLRKH